MLFKKPDPTPSQALSAALSSLDNIKEAVREATADLRAQRADLDEQLRNVTANAERGDKVFENLSALLGE